MSDAEELETLRNHPVLRDDDDSRPTEAQVRDRLTKKPAAAFLAPATGDPQDTVGKGRGLLRKNRNVR